MTRLSPTHPRFRSLLVRAGLAEASRHRLVVPEGLIAHGRGEAFDYLLGERTTPSARRAERSAAQWIANARRPVVSVNGNVAALAAGELARLSRAYPHLAVEINLFHRTPQRARAIERTLRAAGVPRVLGVRPNARIPGLPSDRSRVEAEGIGRADLCLVPLEDGDRVEALRALGIRVISIDLNPLSRTSETAHLPIVDELTRALRTLVEHGPRSMRRRSPGRFPRFAARRALADALRAMTRNLRRRAARRRSPAAARRASERPLRGNGRRRRRTR